MEWAAEPKAVMFRQHKTVADERSLKTSMYFLKQHMEDEFLRVVIQFSFLRYHGNEGI